MNIKYLIELANRVRVRAYAPYSGYAVGAALLADDEIYSGCNIENAAYGACLCAERGAVASAISAGHRSFQAIAVVGGLIKNEAPVSGEPLCTPCGLCRQVLAEFNPDMPVICANLVGEHTVIMIRELLPSFFSGESMDY